MIDGKISNQLPRRRMGGHTCANCCTLMPKPKITSIVGSGGANFGIYHYLENSDRDELKNCYIYETKCGTAVTYCSDKCRKAHNHRFRGHEEIHKVLDTSKKLLAYYVDEDYNCSNCLDGDDSCQCKEVRQFLKNKHETS